MAENMAFFSEYAYSVVWLSDTGVWLSHSWPFFSIKKNKDFVKFWLYFDKQKKKNDYILYWITFIYIYKFYLLQNNNKASESVQFM